MTAVVARVAIAGLSLAVATAAAVAADTAAAPAPIDAPAQALARDISSGKHAGIIGFAVSVDGRPVASSAETDRRPPDIRSATKSITALLVGIALERKELPGLDAKVIDLVSRLPAGLYQGPTVRFSRLGRRLGSRRRGRGG